MFWHNATTLRSWCRTWRGKVAPRQSLLGRARATASGVYQLLLMFCHDQRLWRGQSSHGKRMPLRQLKQSAFFKLTW